jgi:hypothetical protein
MNVRRLMAISALLAAAACTPAREDRGVADDDGGRAEEMVSVHTVTLGFVPERIWRESMATYAATRNPDLHYQHWFVDQHYPVDKEANRAGNRDVCEEHGVRVIDPGRNLGLHDGFNWALAQIQPKAEDIIIAYDPDMSPATPGWDMALVRALRGDPEQRAVWASLVHSQVTPADLEAQGLVASKRQADGYIDLWALQRPIMNSTCAWKASWLSKVGGLSEPRAFYGHLESAMWNKMSGRDQWVFLPGWADTDALRLKHDLEYTEYKWVHSHHQTWDGDFASWLAAGRPNPHRGRV